MIALYNEIIIAFLNMASDDVKIKRECDLYMVQKVLDQGHTFETSLHKSFLYLRLS